MYGYWNDGSFGSGWFLWFGFIFLMLSSFGNWGYTYRAHQRVSGRPDNRALDILDERYARGDITSEQYRQVRSEIARASSKPGADSSVTSPVPVATFVTKEAG